MNNKMHTIGLALALGVATSSAALAANEPRDNEPAEMQALLTAKTTALQAGQAAEAKVGGNVSRITFGLQGEQSVYEVEIVLPGGGAQDVTVNAATGEVTKSSTDEVDQGDDEQDENDGNENG